MFGKYEVVKNVSEYFRKRMEVVIADDNSRNQENLSNMEQEY